MVKRYILILLLTYSILFSMEIEGENIYEKNCLSCHQFSTLKLDKIFFRYLIKYSSELSVKSALIDFLKNPNPQTSVMSKDELRRVGLKTESTLSDDELEEAINIYWDLYDVSKKLW